ncbi:hypothetical protein D9758_000549 [Tetrapyrgos nigripes]|uniref:Homeobox domain-containing protein n=1 Tax=Tetrapyrgos nigripes TaxID=182062 RepID=A0A8H5LZB3_9AGAR|nr:hypothetical protein D9758_000549 [Tetrapyrgos nigripes]
MPPMAQSTSSQDKQKKPRHRHSPAQLAALNELYERDEHPALELRVSLADRLGMETKTVNAWFQNKRASSKKRTMSRPNASYDIPSIPHTTSSLSRPTDMDDFDDDYSSVDYQNPHRSHSPAPSSNGRAWSTFYPGNPEHTQFLNESDNVPRRIRIRPTNEQIEELRKLFNITHHPSTEQRQALAERIGMRYQSITNWFQNQRSTAKKRDGDSITPPEESRTYSAFPPPAPPSLAPRTSHASVGLGRSRRSLSPAPREDLSISRRSLRRSSTPYGSLMESRPRRTRPEQYQLKALNQLYAKTSHPSIEERSALAQEIGMDLGKVTNWFRNVRQTRKRNKKASAASGDEYEDDYHVYSASGSRSDTPSIRSSSPSVNDDIMMDYEDAVLPSGGSISDEGSDDEYEEAVTPSSHRSPSPAPLNKTFGGLNGLPVQRVTLTALSLAAIDLAEMEKESVRSGIKVEDAMLLLTFHQQIVR